MPVVRSAYTFSAIRWVLERVTKRLAETTFTSRSGIRDVVESVLKNKPDKADISSLVDVLLESRKPLVEVKADVEFLEQGIAHELEMIQLSRSGGYKLVEKVEGGVQISRETRRRQKFVEPELKAEEKKKETGKGGRGGGRGGRARGRGRGGGQTGPRLCFKCQSPNHYSANCPMHAQPQ